MPKKTDKPKRSLGEIFNPLGAVNKRNAEAKRAQEATPKGRGDAMRAAAVARGDAMRAAAVARGKRPKK